MQRPALDGEQRRAIAKSLRAFHQSIAPLRITLEMPETADGLIELFGKFPVRGGARLDGLPRVLPFQPCCERGHGLGEDALDIVRPLCRNHFLNAIDVQLPGGGKLLPHGAVSIVEKRDRRFGHVTGSNAIVSDDSGVDCIPGAGERSDE